MKSTSYRFYFVTKSLIKMSMGASESRVPKKLNFVSKD